MYNLKVIVVLVSRGSDARDSDDDRKIRNQSFAPANLKVIPEICISYYR